MAYTIDEINDHAHDLAIEYLYLNEGLIPQLRAAVRSEYSGQMNTQVAELSDRKIIETVISHIEIIKGKKIYLNSPKTHSIPWETFQFFWNNFSE